MPSKRSRRKAAKRPAAKARAKALPADKSRSLSLKSRVGVIIISAAFILGGLYLALTGGSSTSFGNPGTALALEVDYSWIQTDPTARRAEARLRITANRAADSWRMVSQGDYSGDCNESAFSQADATKILAPRPDFPGYFLREASGGDYIDHFLRTGDDSKRHCYEASVTDGSGNTERAYLLSPEIGLGGPAGLSVARSGNRLTVTADRPILRWRTLRSDHWAAAAEDCEADAYGAAETNNQILGPGERTTMLLDLTAADENRSYCFEALSYQGFFAYVAVGPLKVGQASPEDKILRYWLSVDGRGYLEVERTSGPVITGWQAIEVSGKSDCVTASFGDGRRLVADTSGSGKDLIRIQYGEDTDYCFKAVRTSGSTAPVYVTAEDIEAAEPTQTVDKLAITGIRQITRQSTGEVVLEATTNRPVVGGVAIRGDKIGTGLCGVNSFTAANEAHQLSRRGDPFYIAVTRADNGYEFCFKVEEERDGRSHFATAVFRGGVNIPADDGTTAAPGSGQPTAPPTTDQPPAERPPGGAPDNQPPTITVTHRESPAKLTAKASEFVSTWRISGPYAADPECAAEHFAGDFSLGSEIDLRASDQGKWYCFAARDEAGNWGYAVKQVPGSDDEESGAKADEGGGDEDDESDESGDEADKEKEDEQAEDSESGNDEAGAAADGISDPGSGVSSFILWIVVGAAAAVGIVITVIIVGNLKNKPKF